MRACAASETLATSGVVGFIYEASPLPPDRWNLKGSRKEEARRRRRPACRRRQTSMREPTARECIGAPLAMDALLPFRVVVYNTAEQSTASEERVMG